MAQVTDSGAHVAAGPVSKSGRYGRSFGGVYLLDVAIAAILAAAVPSLAAAQRPVQQNPSPMVEHTRLHERLTQRRLDGSVRTFPGPGGRPVELFVPGDAPKAKTFDVVVHFHGAPWLAHQAVADLRGGIVAAVVNLGTGSSVYDRTYADPAAFDSLLAGITREVSATTGSAGGVGAVTLTAFSAGHGAIRALLREPRHFATVGAVLLLDGMHTSYVPERTVLAEGAGLDTANLVPFADFGRAAARGEKRLIVTHSEIFPGTFASTTETADWLLGALGLRRTAVLRWGPRGMQQLSEVRAGAFELLGFAGNSAPDHIDHLHAMPELLTRTLTLPRTIGEQAAHAGWDAWRCVRFTDERQFKEAVMGSRDPRVDAYIEKSAEFAQPILRYLRKVIHEASPAIEETMKWGCPHFMHHGIVCGMASFKAHCAFGFWKGSLIFGEAGAASEDAMGQFGRIEAISDLPPRETLIGYVQEAMKLNEAGVKVPRKTATKRAQELEIPEPFRVALERHPDAAASFARFSPSRRREYVEWIAEAKRDDTRDRRIRTALEWIAEGKPRNWKYIKR